ncbi:8-oxo-dGTP diphosphatase [Arthrobacter sp. UYEF3]|uniref:8-oxo-dGTP diphosphatase n=1 Tax=Arthrobacter sp. UYEF3 TaxID=1756365 RepID=UPI0033999306
MPLTPVTLCFLLRDARGGTDAQGGTAAQDVTGVQGGTEVLLGLKRTGFGTGKIVGIGGHVEPGESDAEAAVREVWEEAGVVVRQEDLADVGLVEFIFPARLEWSMSCRLFTTRRWEGEPSDSPEISPEWFDAASLPLERMWQDAEHWLPSALAGGTVDVVVVLNEDNETVASVRNPSTRG